MTVLPYKESQANKKQQVAQMFNNISKRYDFLNHVLSLGIDTIWRENAVSMLKSYQPKIILDIATGTGDFALKAMSLKPDKIIGVDISEGMLEVGRKKISKKFLSEKIKMQLGDSENLHFENNSIDAITVGFGVRNFSNLKKSLHEMFRVLKPRGVVSIIEFSQPHIFPFKQLYYFYFNLILPKVGSAISKDRSAYSYLPESVKSFPHGKDFMNMLNKIGFKNTQCKPQTFGISSIYMAEKP